jgi:hypothetical protein
MKIAKSFIVSALLVTACTVNQEAVKNQIGVNTNQTAATNQNTNLQNVATESAKKDIDYFAHFNPQHREVLREWLKSKKYLRPAVEEIDSSYFENGKVISEDDLQFLRETVGKDGYQYYSVGDMNHDRQKDFAVLLVDTRKPANKDEPDYFALAIFNAPFKKGQRPNYYEEKLYGISNSYIVFDKMIEKYLFLGKFESDVYCATYYPKGKTYYFKDCIE